MSGKGGELIRQPREPVLLDIPPAAAEGEFYSVRLIYDANNMQSVSVAGILDDLIAEYGRQQSRRQLDARGFDVRMLQPVTVERVQAGRRASLAALFYKLIPPLAVFMIFLGAVYLSIDTTTGERERGTLEPLLTAPLPRWELLLGKATAALLFTLFAVAFNLTAFRVVLGLVAARLAGLEPPPATATFLTMFGLSLPLMVLAVAIQITIATLTRSMKEAQIYLGLLPLIPALPGVATSLAPVTPQLWMAGIPVFGQMVMFGRLFSGLPLNPLYIALSSVATLSTAALIFWWATRLFDRERLFTPG
ncbi:ABC-2 type transport system permease protein [Azospirillaceae bacterium]